MELTADKYASAREAFHESGEKLARAIKSGRHFDSLDKIEELVALRDELRDKIN